MTLHRSTGMCSYFFVHIRTLADCDPLPFIFFIFHDGRAANTPAGMRPDGESIKASTRCMRWVEYRI
jgi:hypothetical protein